MRVRDTLEFAETDTLLRDDVRRLGTMVGDMLAEQVSAERLEQGEPARGGVGHCRQSMPLPSIWPATHWPT